MLVLTDQQEVDLTVVFTDKAGNPAIVDGAPTWSSSDTTVVTVEPSSDGLSAVAIAVGKLGQAQVSVSGDADLGTGSTPVTGVLDIQVQAAAAVSASINAGTPTDKP